MIRLSFAVVIAFFGSVSFAADSFEFADAPKEGHLDITFGGQKVLRYMYAYDTTDDKTKHNTYKVFHHVYGPGTDTRITKGPGGKYTHHRGLYVGFSKTKVGKKSLDFWHCKAGVHLRHAKFLKKEAKGDSATLSTEIHWNDAKGDPVIREVRTVTVTKAKAEGGFAWQIDWSSTLNSERGKIELNGDRQHAGFQFRADQPVAEANSATYIRPKNFPQQEKAYQVNDKPPLKHVNLGWLAMSFPLKKDRFTIAYFEDPKMPKPSRYSERPYGRFGAFFVTTIDTDKPLKMRYRVLVFKGDAPKRDALQERYEQFVEAIK